MKKLLVVLLSLGLIAAFSMTASAADVKFSGQYYVTGAYESNRSLKDTDATNSLAVFFQRVRVQTVFQVAEGLKFTTRFDALEKYWGGTTAATVGTEDKTNSRSTTFASLQENIEFEQGYVTFNTAAGMFQIGYQDADTWGTGFADTPGTRPRIMYIVPAGPVTIGAVYEKVYDTTGHGSTGTAAALYGKADADWDNYALSATYKFKGGNTGLLFKFVNAATTRPGFDYRAKQYVLAPYLKATYGPVYVEGELVFLAGKTKEYDTAAAGTDVKATGWGGYALAKMKMGPAYFGAQVGFSSGNDTTTADKDESGPKSSVSWVPALIFGESNVKTWIGGANHGGANGVTYSTDKQNLLLFNIFGGFNPTPKLNVEARLSTMKADKVAANYVSDKYGTEFD
ncbi:MAG: hypothetical protein KKF02_05145, partial [Proteobacteria bacterium]|nr:hypothetical protein [Pseudomonadota bacterium]